MSRSEEGFVERLCLRSISRSVSKMLADRDFYYPEIAYVIRAHIDPSIRSDTCVPIVHEVHMPDTLPAPPSNAGGSEYLGSRRNFLDIVGHIELSILECRPYMDVIRDVANDVYIIMNDGDFTKFTSEDMFNTWCARITT